MNDIIAFISWYLVILLVGWLSFPILSRLLPYLSDRGYSYAKAFGLLIWSYTYWLLATLGIVQNNTGGVFSGILLIILLNIFLIKGKKFQQIYNWIKHNRGLLISSEIVFVVAFIFLTLLRLADPSIVGTEKPMELAFIQSILRSPSFPPADPWLSGYSISYYYLGYVMVAGMARFTGVDGAIAFNLGIALWFGLTAQGAYGILHSLLQRWMSQPLIGGVSQLKRKLNPHKWALLAPVFILILSNWTGALDSLHARGIFWNRSLPGEQMSSSFWSWLNIKELDRPPTEPFSWAPKRSGGIWWWRASRVLQDFDMAGNEKEIINEFPFFSYYLADLHPHLLSMPFVLLTLAMTANLFFSGKKNLLEDSNLVEWIKTVFVEGKGNWRSLLLVKYLRDKDIWISAWILGSLAFINFWDFPIYLGLFVLVNLWLKVNTLGWNKKFILDFFEQAVYLGVLGIFLYLPFHLGFSSQAGGFLPSISFFTRGVYFWVMFGPLLVPLIAWLIWLTHKQGEKPVVGVGFGAAALLLFGLWLVSYGFGWLFLSGQTISEWILSLKFASPGLLNLGFRIAGLSRLFFNLHGSSNMSEIILGSLVRRMIEPGTWITLLLLIGFCLSYLIHSIQSKGLWKILNLDNDSGEAESGVAHHTSKHPHSFILLLVLTGAGLALMPEFVYLRDQFGWRMNTIFKFYFQVWILWGIAAAYATVVLFTAAQNWKGIFIKLLLAISLVCGLAYPVFAINSRLTGKNINDFTLDGSKFPRMYNKGDFDAIQWLQSAPYGVVAEAIGGSYSNFARVSTHSGLPTVLGWPGHESQWRGGAEEMGSRQPDIETLYRIPDWETAREIIERYEIRYIFVGQLEKNTYQLNETKFINNLVLVYRNESVVIYEAPDYKSLNRLR